jgi:hypothetical protein
MQYDKLQYQTFEANEYDHDKPLTECYKSLNQICNIIINNKCMCKKCQIEYPIDMIISDILYQIDIDCMPKGLILIMVEYYKCDEQIKYMCCEIGAKGETGQIGFIADENVVTYNKKEIKRYNKIKYMENNNILKYKNKNQKNYR